ncbi:MAG: response regulator, partial [Luminiphilus sp.]
MSALADESLSQPVQLDATAQDDLAQLLSANTRLGEIINIQGSEARHDRRNIIGAIRGYTEMLLEEADSSIPSALKRSLLLVLDAAKGEPLSDTQGRNPAIPLPRSEEPGVILAVDDLPENRELVSRLLQKTGHTVITAESGEEALELLDTMGVDVVLLDLVMPGIGGAEVLRQLKDNEQLRATPVVMISGQQDMDQIVGCIEAGADDYLLKPFNPVLLQAR